MIGAPPGVGSALLKHSPNTTGCALAVADVLAEAGAPDGLFAALLVAAVNELTIGDPEQDGIDIGPMARADLVNGIDRQVQASVAVGARVLTGGHPLDRPGYYYAPTVLADAKPGMPVYDEETFGPVAAVIVAADTDDAIRIANDTEFGLACSVWTSDLDKGVAVGKRINSGALFINAVVASDVRMPFGGTRRSGYGRELAQAGIREFVNTRTFVLNNEPPRRRPPPNGTRRRCRNDSLVSGTVHPGFSDQQQGPTPPRRLQRARVRRDAAVRSPPGQTLAFAPTPHRQLPTTCTGKGHHP